MTRHHEVATGGYGLPSAAAATIADQQVRNMGTIGGTLAHGDPASDLPGDPARRTRARVIIRGVRRRARGRGGGLLRGLPDDRGRRGRDPHRGPASRRWRATATATRSSTAARRTGRWWPSRALVKKGGDGTCADVRVGLTHMGSDAAAGDRGRGGAARPAADRGDDRRGRRARRRGHRAARGPQRLAGLQAPPGAGAVQARARRPRHMSVVSFRNSAGRDGGPGRRGLPRRPGPRHRPPTSPSRSSSRCCWRARRAWARPRWRGRWRPRPAPS